MRQMHSWLGQTATGAGNGASGQRPAIARSSEIGHARIRSETQRAFYQRVVDARVRASRRVLARLVVVALHIVGDPAYYAPAKGSEEVGESRASFWRRPEWFASA